MLSSFEDCHVSTFGAASQRHNIVAVAKQRRSNLQISDHKKINLLLHPVLKAIFHRIPAQFEPGILTQLVQVEQAFGDLP